MRVANDVKGGDDNTFALDKGANYQLPEPEEELADYDSDSTALEEEEDEEAGEGYDSDDTAFDYEDYEIPDWDFAVCLGEIGLAQWICQDGNMVN